MSGTKISLSFFKLWNDFNLNSLLHRTSLLMITMLDYLYLLNSSPAAAHLLYFLMDKFKHSTFIVHLALSALGSLVPAPPKLLITEKAKHEDPFAAAVPISPHPEAPGLTHRPLCLLLSFGNSCAVITECVPRLNSCFLLLQRQSDTPSPETHN